MFLINNLNFSYSATSHQTLFTLKKVHKSAIPQQIFPITMHKDITASRINIPKVKPEFKKQDLANRASPSNRKELLNHIINRCKRIESPTMKFNDSRNESYEKHFHPYDSMKKKQRTIKNNAKENIARHEPKYNLDMHNQIYKQESPDKRFRREKYTSLSQLSKQPQKNKNEKCGGNPTIENIEEDYNRHLNYCRQQERKMRLLYLQLQNKIQQCKNKDMQQLQSYSFAKTKQYCALKGSVQNRHISHPQLKAQLQKINAQPLLEARELNDLQIQFDKLTCFYYPSKTMQLLFSFGSQKITELSHESNDQIPASAKNHSTRSK